ncbi:MAG: hypothetical protein RLY78_1697, partial [Pseudomonadota bacterium]
MPTETETETETGRGPRPRHGQTRATVAQCAPMPRPPTRRAPAPAPASSPVSSPASPPASPPASIPPTRRPARTPSRAASRSPARDLPLDQVFARVRQHWPEVADTRMALTMSVFRLARLLEDSARRALEPLGLTSTEFELLSILRASPPPHCITPSELRAAVLLSSGGLTKVLKTLEARGLIARPPSAGDGRSRPLQATMAGIRLTEQAMAVVRKAEAV